MRREGSPWAGLWTVTVKEATDHLSSTRMRLLEILILLTAVGTIYSATQSIRNTVGQDPFLFLTLFTTGHDPIPSFTGFIGFLVPLTAIALGFDAINSEHSGRTLSRVLAQPIYRDALILGKFLGALATLSIVLVALWLLVAGLGLLMLGLPPSGEEVARGGMFLLATIAYGAVWLTMAMLFSTIFRQPATAALAALALWLVLTIFWPMVASALAGIFAAHDPNLYLQLANQMEVEQAISRVSPNTLYGEVVLALLHPETRALGPVFYSQLQGAILGAPLPVGESMLLVWPHMTGLVAGSILLFTLNYATFQRQEIRA
jgi:ABC-2 type transport system permease protein